uniref:Uncharacterized protein n=1 Tax=Chaetoceros debilis TaxID=122233 RepID=A0A7S3QJD8_9STRA|mmetsp:Transcript_18912/g.27858  ORF Transcript_18912/g.27858 Transcript_18912/m.27858 type:complete len:324 (+) Transcript_18912:14-985(+)
MTAKFKAHSISSKCTNDEKTKDRKRVPCAQDYYPSTFSRSNRDFSPIRIRKKLLLLNKAKNNECAGRSEELPPVYSSTDSVFSSSSTGSISDSSSISSRSGANRYYSQPAPKPTPASSSSTFDGVGNLYQTRPGSLIPGSKFITSKITKRAGNKTIDTLTKIELSSSFESNLSASTSSKSSASMEDSFSIMQQLKFNFLKDQQLENKEKKKLPIGHVKAKVGHCSMYRYTNTEGFRPTLDKKTRHARSIPRARTVDSTRNEKFVSTKEAIYQPNYSRNPTMAALRASIKKIDREYRISESQEKSESYAPYNDIMLGYNKTRRK